MLFYSVSGRGGIVLFSEMNEYIQKDYSRFHIPGHKGFIEGQSGMSGLLQYDLTEIPGMDSLYDADGIIADLESRIADFYKTEASLISCGGSSLSIMTMLKLALSEGDRVVMGRNSHVSAINAAALIGFEPVWVYPVSDDGGHLPGRILSEDVDKALSETSDVKAVYITSPDFYGVMSDVRGIARVCDRYGVPLLVDNAHGAHLPLVGNSHPIVQGAAMCSDSAHKTLPTLTGSGFLHIACEEFAKKAKSVMSVFGSTSPSYLMMLSMDLCMDYMSGAGRLEYNRLAQSVYGLKKLALENGFSVPGGLCDPIRLSLSAWDLGYTGEDLADYLDEFRIMPEFIGSSYVVLVPTPHNSQRDFDRIGQAILNIYEARPLSRGPDVNITKPKRAMSIREAFMSADQIVKIEDAVGSVSAESKSICPPGIPVVVAGEIIDSNLVDALFRCGVFDIKVVK